MDCLVRYGEIAIKGKNRSDFELRLVSNMQEYLRSSGVKSRVERTFGRLIVWTDKPVDFRRVMGVYSFSPCRVVEGELGAIKEGASFFISSMVKGESFKVETQRLDKGFPATSMRLNQELGAYVVEKTGAKVDLSNPDKVLHLEIIRGKAYLFTEVIHGFGGLPLGVEGRVALLVENEKSLLAGLLMMKRGCAVVPVAFSEQDISLLEAFSYGQGMVLKVVEGFSALEELMAKKNCRALVTGDSFSDLVGLREIGLSPVLRPLLAMDSAEISERLELFRKVSQSL